MPENEPFNAPQDLTNVSDAELSALETQGVSEFDRIHASNDVTPEALQYVMRLTGDLDRVRAELAARQVRAATAAEAERIRVEREMATLQSRVHGEGAPNLAPILAPAPAAPAAIDTEAIAAAAARGATAALFAAMGDRRMDLGTVAQRATATLAETARVAPTPVVPSARLSVTASVEIPGVDPGRELPSLTSLAEAFQRKAKSLSVSRSGAPEGPTVATIRNEFTNTVDDRTSPAQVEELFHELRSRDKQDALVAGGGWCAPSEIKYDFFNVSCSDGLIDLPTFGVSRGGIRFPVSPSLASAVWTVGGVANQNLAGFGTTLSNASMPWLWTEADDILTVTGSVNKPCVRVPCPTFSEARLECYGICLTAGNLTDSAYPEATENTLRLLMAAHDRAINGRLIAQMVSLSTTVATGIGVDTGGPVYQQVLGSVNLAATDYRESLGMCIDDVLEVILPHWIVPMIQSDLAWRTGADTMLSVTKAQIISYFADRNVRVQFVDDWQVRAAGLPGATTPLIAWPTSVNMMVYAAGTFMRGTGLTLDLGVIRDSVLNAENDYTAAWTEECNLIALVGHSSRIYPINFAVTGQTGAAAAPATAAV